MERSCRDAYSLLILRNPSCRDDGGQESILNDDDVEPGPSAASQRTSERYDISFIELPFSNQWFKKLHLVSTYSVFDSYLYKIKYKVPKCSK